MALEPGRRLGSFEVLSPVGVGGMGEVYRARDKKLGRDVALKVLPSAFAADPDRMARFEREAHLLASLNHPGIAALYGLEEEDPIRALVMELVEGPTLAERIAQSPMPLEETLPVAKQIAEALEYAHEHGIVHRDLKPSNVKVTPEGTVKVLDFGLAKALEDTAAAQEISRSPTLTAVATRAGIILGTPAYMSPEQAKGRPSDRRSDIWSFGVVLYEMLTGRRPYRGETSPETLARVLGQDPELSVLPPATPRQIRDLLRRCLTKDPRSRLQAIGEARIAIESAMAQPEAPTRATESGRTLVAPAAQPLWRRALPWTLAGALGLALVLVLWAPRRPAPAASALRLSAELGADVSLATDSGPAAILSPDGATLAFVGRKGGSETQQLYLRRLEQLQASPLSGTEGAADPFFSPDGQWIGFFAKAKLKKVSVRGGAAVTLADAPDPRGGSWGEDGTIVFAPTTAGAVSRVSSAGGKPEALTTLDQNDGEVTHGWPQVLRGGRAVLFTAHSRTGWFNEASLVVQLLPGGPRKVVHRGGHYGRYLPSGHLAFISAGTLFAAPFDVERLETTGQAVPALEGVSASSATGRAQFAFSSNGALVYLPGRGAGGTNVSILWMDREGKTEPLPVAPGNYYNIRFSPDGGRLVLDMSSGQERDVWIYDWRRDTMSRLTFDPHEDAWPAWTPDGRRIAFASARGDEATWNLYWQRADGTGEAQRLTESKNRQWPTSWHPSGTVLAFTEVSTQTFWDIWILPMDGDGASAWKPGQPTVFLHGPFNEFAPAFSPDGRWLAYASNESGSYEVYVRPFPGPGGTWLVSTGGGVFPTWSRDGRELFYRTEDQRLMVAAYTAEGDSFRAEKPRLWSEGQFTRRGFGRNFDLHPDGQRFAVLEATQTRAEAGRDKVVFIFNFPAELRRIAPAAGR